eukprot:TRINITY_DN31889_c0_g1_i1.p1 TRINITY_DN31889_c0_g1~~TRINITY_DN31889_c0_g1_i1.p1  ORF type:complete len:441 (+),score=56.63 TRINITY_DN31889_c0_g1_i1:80-1402(+)
MGKEVEAASRALAWHSLDHYHGIKLDIKYGKACPEPRANFGLPDWLTATFLQPGGTARNLMALSQSSCKPLLQLTFYVFQKLPPSLKSAFVHLLWRGWLKAHKVLPARVVRRGLSDTWSLEAHAMQNVLWWVRLFPAPLWVTRFGLSQVSLTRPPQDARKEWIAVSPETPAVKSLYIHTAPPTLKKPRVLFLIFGGAYLGGSVEGYTGLAEHYGKLMSCDVFIAGMRICPEFTMQDAILDAYRGYEWLLQKVPAENIVCLGVSSGGGICVRMLQLAKSDAEARQSFFGNRCSVPLMPLPQPAGAVLMGAFVEYTKVTKSMQQNTALDWVVTPGVLELVLSHQSVMAGGRDKLMECSPLYHSMEGLCPLLLTVSAHECLIDENVELAARARTAGVDVRMSVQPYLCHVFQFFSSFLPEAAREESRICEWVRGRHDAQAAVA